MSNDLPEDKKELVRYYFDELEAGNLGVIDEVFADKFHSEYDVARSSVGEVDKDGLSTVLGEILTAFDTSIESQTLFVDGNNVIVIQTWHGTHEGEYRGIEPSGNEVTYELWARFVIEDNQIVHADVQGDDFGLFIQLGLELSIEGYRKLIETAPDPIVIADIDTGRVLETNSATESLLERPRQEIIGVHQRELHPPDPRYDGLFKEGVSRAQNSRVSLSSFDDGSDIEVARRDGSRVTVAASVQVVTLAEQKSLVCIFRDISDRRRREQRTQVLNRILRHNLRNELGVVAGLAGVLSEELNGTAADRADKITERAQALTALGEKARLADAITTAEATEASKVSIRGVVDEVVAEIADSDSGAEIRTTFTTPVTVVTIRRALTIALREAVENAIEHGTEAQHEESSNNKMPLVRISLNQYEDSQGVDIVVENSGPSIPEHELSVLKAEQETALTHGSGIGLWLIHWGMNAIRGDVSFGNGKQGPRVTLHVPSLESAVNLGL